MKKMVDLSIVYPLKMVMFHSFPIKNGGSFHRFQQPFVDRKPAGLEPRHPPLSAQQQRLRAEVDGHQVRPKQGSQRGGR